MFIQNTDVASEQRNNESRTQSHSVCFDVNRTRPRPVEPVELARRKHGRPANGAVCELHPAVRCTFVVNEMENGARGAEFKRTSAHIYIPSRYAHVYNLILTVYVGKGTSLPTVSGRICDVKCFRFRIPRENRRGAWTSAGVRECPQAEGT